MALDHTRDFFTNARFAPEDLERTSAALYFTRWVTHFCAPTFVLLAGLGAGLARNAGVPTSRLAARLVLRGLWLIVLELTIVRFAYTFDPSLRALPLLVLWAIGVSMIILAGLAFLPRTLIAVFGIFLIVGHNAFDRVRPTELGPWGPLWQLIHAGGALPPLGPVQIFAAYPIIPWVGVMALGFALADWYRLDDGRRRRLFIGLGLLLTVTFLLVRSFNQYGDANVWRPWDRPLWTVMDFLDCTKYPPSLNYLLMTLGPALVVLALAEHPIPKPLRFIVTYGRVPLAFYIIHWYVAHLLAIGVALATGRRPAWSLFDPDPSWGFDLSGVYLAWIAVLILMYPVCRVMLAKKERGSPWVRWL
jgi:uncharacterized membrane protein